MELTVLGCGGTWADPGGATSGYLLQQDGFNLWMDAGNGTLSRLEKIIPMGKIDAVVITHAHPDHFVDLYPCFYARHYGETGTPGLPLFAPPGCFERVSALVSDDSQQAMWVAYGVNEVQPGDVHRIGPFEVKVFEMSHLGVEAVGYRIASDGTTLAYTGDTGPTDQAVELARNADLLVSEATWQDHQELLPFHLSARQAAEQAKEAGAARLVLTHIWPIHDKQDSLAQAADVYDGPLDIAREGMSIKVGS